MKRFSWNSTPLVNLGTYADFLGVDLDRLMSGDLLTEIAAMHKAAHQMQPIEFHKHHLGRQDFCWNGEYRFWVWEGENWRVFASNIQGVSFEVRETLSGKEALQAWDDYRRRVMLLQFERGSLVHVYADDRPVRIEFPDPRYGGHYVVTAENNSKEQMRVAVDNIRETYELAGIKE